MGVGNLVLSDNLSFVITCLYGSIFVNEQLDVKSCVSDCGGIIVIRCVLINGFSSGVPRMNYNQFENHFFNTDNARLRDFGMIF